MEQANIIVDNGGRIGTNEITRLGFGVREIEEVAELVGMVVLGKKPTELVKKRVKTLIKDFREPKYVLKSVPKIVQ